MGTTEVKNDTPDSCVSGRAAIPPIPEVRTADLVLKWAQLEPAPGTYDWSTLDNAVSRARLASGQLIVLLWTGQDTPHWLYNGGGGGGGGDGLGVPVLAHNRDSSAFVPDYTSPVYQRRLRAVHSALARRIESEGYGPSIMALQPCVGSTGDDTPIHVTSDGGHPSGWTWVNQTLLAEINGPGDDRSNSTWWVDCHPSGNGV